MFVIINTKSCEVMSIYEVIVDTLTEIECRELPRLLVLNKLDAVPPGEAESLALALRVKGEDVLGISALQGTGLRGLLMSVERELASRSEWFTRPASFDALRKP